MRSRICRNDIIPTTYLCSAWVESDAIIEFGFILPSENIKASLLDNLQGADLARNILALNGWAGVR